MKFIMRTAYPNSKCWSCEKFYVSVKYGEAMFYMNPHWSSSFPINLNGSRAFSINVQSSRLREYYGYE